MQQGCPISPLLLDIVFYPLLVISYIPTCSDIMSLHLPSRILVAQPVMDR